MDVLERLVVLSLKQNRKLMPEQQFHPLNGDDLSSDISSRSAAFSDQLFSDIIPQSISFIYGEQSSAGPSTNQQPPLRKKKKKTAQWGDGVHSRQQMYSGKCRGFLHRSRRTAAPVATARRKWGAEFFFLCCCCCPFPVCFLMLLFWKPNLYYQIYTIY